MANDYEKIDSLGIDIVVNKEAVQSAKNIDKVANALNNLQNAIASLDLSTLNKAFESLEKLANVRFSGTSKINTKQLEKVGKIIHARNANLISKINQTQKSGEISGSISSKPKNTNDTKDIVENFSILGKIMDLIGSSAKKQAKNINKFVRSFGRVAFYRTIRFALSQTVKLFTQGLDNLAKSIPEVSNTMSKLQSSVALVSNSLGSLLYTLLDAFSPAIESISKSFSGFINDLNKVIAISAGADYYYEATEAVRDYDKALNNLSFDKFESLNNADANIFKKVDLKDEQGNIIPENAKLNKSQQTLSNVFDILKEVWSALKEVGKALSGMLKPLLDEISKIITDIAGAIQWLNMKNIVGDVSALEAILWGLVAVLGIIAIKNVLVAVTNPFTLIAGSLIALIVLVGVFSDEINTAVENFKRAISNVFRWFVNLGISFINLIIDGINNLIGLINKLPFVNIGYVGKLEKMEYKEMLSFANGGQYQTGDFFMANENGATEMIASSNGGGSVMNLRQWQQISEQSFYTALYKYGASRGNIEDLELGVYMDSKEVGKAVENSVYNEGVRVGHFSRAK